VFQSAGVFHSPAIGQQFGKTETTPPARAAWAVWNAIGQRL